MTRLSRTLSEYGLVLDEYILEHLELSLPECESTTEKQDLLEPFLQDAGLNEIEEFMQKYLSWESDEVNVEEDEITTSTSQLELNDNDNLPDCDSNQSNEIKADQPKKLPVNATANVKTTTPTKKTNWLDDDAFSKFKLTDPEEETKSRKSKSKSQKKAIAKPVEVEIVEPSTGSVTPEQVEAIENPDVDITSNWSSQGAIGKRLQA
ncbi:hypothetical protein BC833DRAFT_273428, partial [Globomyces pollinis-pini]